MRLATRRRERRAACGMRRAACEVKRVRSLRPTGMWGTRLVRSAARRALQSSHSRSAQAVSARESAEAFEVGLFVGWAAGALRFPNGFGQAFDHHVLGFVRMAA